MALILAVEPDRRQAAQLAAIGRARLDADLVIAPSADAAIVALGGRIPDLILTSALLSPKDEAALSDRLRALDGAAAHVQSLTIPVLATAAPRKRARPRGVLAALRGKPKAGAPDGCDPALFAEQIETYLQRAHCEREALDGPAAIEPPAPAVIAAPKPAIVVESKPTIVAESEPAPEPIAQTVDVQRDAGHEPQASPEAVTLPEPVLDEQPRGDELTLLFDASGISVSDAASIEIVETAQTMSESEISAPTPDGEEIDLSLLLDQEMVEAFEPAPAAIAPDAVEPVPVAAEPVAAEVVALETTAAAPELIELWTPLLLSAGHVWPAIEGVISEEAPEPAAAAPEPPPAPIAEPPAAVVEPQATAIAIPAAQWLEALESLRRDIEQLRSERSVPTLVAAPPVSEPSAPAPEPVAATPAPAPETPARRKKQKSKPVKPIQDEWGLFDPDQCGFAALLAKLEEMTEEETPRRPS